MKKHTTKLLKELKYAKEILFLQPHVVDHVAKSKNAQKIGLGFIIVSCLANVIGQLYLFPMYFLGSASPKVFDLLNATIIRAVLLIAFIWFTWKIGKYFKGRASFKQLFNIFSYASILGVITIIPQLSLIACIWFLILYYKLLGSVHKLHTDKIIFTFIGSLVGMIILESILTSLGIVSTAHLPTSMY